MNNTKIYLCNAEGAMLGSVTGIKADTCSLTKNATDFWEISFEVDRYIEVNGTLTQSSYYDSIDDMMRLYLDSENTQAFFVIDSEPVIRGSGLQETKSVTAHSIECELNHVYLKNLKINCGTSDSQEYLATDSNGNFYNINPYTGLPYEYISLINYNDTQLSLLHLVLQNTGWTVKEGIGTLYLDNDDYFKIILTTVSDPSGSLERAVGCVKKRWSDANGVYAIELQKWDSAAIEFTTKDITDITITAQGIDTISSTAENTSAYSPIALKDANGNIISNEDGITRVYGNTEDEKGITINYRGLKPGTYKITSPYDAALNRGVQIKTIIVAEQNAAEGKKIQHVFKASDLTSAKDNEEITGLCQIKGSFDTSDSVYSFLMKTVSPAASVIFEFDRKHKTVGVVRAADYGKDTGVFITMRNLMNSFEVTSSSQDSIMTKLTPKGANDLGIEYVNFGKDYILNLDYFMNELNEYGDYKFVSRDLHDKYNIWKNYRETDIVSDNDKTYTRRELYKELTKQYNKTVLEISELKNRVPNDGCLIDYTTYSLEDLKTSLTAYRKALASLITLYKNEYGVTALGNAPDYSPAPKGAVSIKNTPYWYDFYAYQECIIPQVEEALKMYCQTDENGNLVVDENGDYIELDTGNTDYYADTSIVKTVDSYLYEWSLYGLDELEAKKKAWSEAANLLFNECFVNPNYDASKDKLIDYYRTPDDDDKKGWNSLSDEEKSAFTTQNAYISQLKSYLDYLSFDERENSLTGTTCKGIIRQCDDAITGRTNEIAEIEGIQAKISLKRSELAQSVLLEEITIDGEKLFSNDDLAVITSLMRETDYTNETILITNLDDIVSEVDAQEELYHAATGELYKISQPQYSFSTELDNLFSLEEFKAYQEPFDVGNYIRVGLQIHEELYDNNYIKLRLISMTYNPLEISENLSVEFSTMTKSLNGISDLAFLLDSEISSSRSSSSGSSSGGGTYGNNDANVQISNNMLNALLSTELFGTAVTDVILDSIQANKGDFNTLFSRSGVFDSLETGQIKVSGDCLTDRIKSWNWNGTDSDLLSNTKGSIIDLSNGKFNFAGGKLKWDGEILSVKGNGEFTGTIYGTAGKFEGSINVNDNFIVDESGNVTADGTLTASNANISGKIHATNSTISQSQIIDGDVTANSLTAARGSIGGWNFNEDSFFKTSENFMSTDGFYLGINGFSIKNFFAINDSNFILRTANYVAPKYSNTLDIPQKTNPSGEIFPLRNVGTVIPYSNYAVHNHCRMHIYINNLPTPKETEIHFYIKAIFYWRQFLDGVDYHHGTTEGIWSISLGALKCFGTIGVYILTLENLKYCNIVNVDNDGNYLLQGAWCIENPNCELYKVDIISIDAGSFDNGISTTYNGNIQKVDFAYNYLEDISSYGNGEASIEYYLTIPGIITELGNGMEINSISQSLKLGSVVIDTTSITGYSDFDFKIKELNSSEEKVCINSSKLKHLGVYDSIVSSGSQLRIGEDGLIQRYSSSSKRYKYDILPIDKSDDDLNPHKLYELDVVSYKYNNNYLSENDDRYQKNITGLIAENVEEKYPIACTHNLDGSPEMWEVNILFPAALKLIQEQHKDIEELKDEIEKLKQK